MQLALKHLFNNTLVNIKRPTNQAHLLLPLQPAITAQSTETKHKNKYMILNIKLQKYNLTFVDFLGK